MEYFRFLEFRHYSEGQSKGRAAFGLLLEYSKQPERSKGHLGLLLSFLFLIEDDSRSRTKNYGILDYSFRIAFNGKTEGLPH